MENKKKTKIKTFSKKPNKAQKLALERIYRLFELAKNVDEEKYKKRYIELAQIIGKKNKVKIPIELKKKYCKKCISMEVIEKKEPPFLIIKCKVCKFEKKYSLEKNNPN
jgi:ribonuclease P protein subunit RPR2